LQVTQRGQVHARVLLTQIHKDSIEAIGKTFLGRNAIKRMRITSYLPYESLLFIVRVLFAVSVFMALIHMLIPCKYCGFVWCSSHADTDSPRETCSGCASC
jgi:hypothetical protein